MENGKPKAEGINVQKQKDGLIEHVYQHEVFLTET
jgi:hypothetical protein